MSTTSSKPPRSSGEVWLNRHQHRLYRLSTGEDKITPQLETIFATGRKAARRIDTAENRRFWAISGGRSPMPIFQSPDWGCAQPRKQGEAGIRCKPFKSRAEYRRGRYSDIARFAGNNR